MHAELRTTAAAAQSNKTRQVVDDVHEQYDAYLQAQLVRQAVASVASAASAYQRETAPIRAMARELLGFSPINFAMVTQEEANAYMRIRGSEGTNVKYSPTELYEISRSISAHHGTPTSGATTAPTDTLPETVPILHQQAEATCNEPMPDLVTDPSSKSSGSSSDSDTIPDLASASTSGDEGSNDELRTNHRYGSSSHILSSYEWSSPALDEETPPEKIAGEHPPLPVTHDTPEGRLRLELAYRAIVGTATRAQGASATSAAPTTRTEEQRTMATRAGHTRDVNYAEHLQASLAVGDYYSTVGADHRQSDLPNSMHPATRSTDPNLGGGAAPASAGLDRLPARYEDSQTSPTAQPAARSPGQTCPGQRSDRFSNNVSDD